MLSEYWKNKDKRRGILGTVLFHLALLLVFIFMGLTYYEPKPEDGIIINFGNSETGFGDQANEAQSAVQETQKEQPTEETEVTEETEEPVRTQNTIDAPAIEPKASKEVKAEKPVEPEKPKPSSDLTKLLENVENTKQSGEGVTKGSGDQGSEEGDPNSNNRMGGAGGGNGSGNYMLGNRKALNKPTPEYPCPEQGRVVVKIYVDRDGTVTRAIPGEKIPNGTASTTTSGCLYDKAKNAALRTTWQADSDAPTLQVGYIIYNFVKN